MKLGLISDTHNYLDPRVADIFADVDHILHAGDVGDHLILVELEQIAPLTAVLGNNDSNLPIPETAVVTLGGKKFLLHHIVTPGLGPPAIQARILAEAPDVVMFGHSHKPFAEQIGSTLFLNPGYAGRPRFKLERSVAVLEIADGKITHRFVPL
jgi:putative phosphoesterase